ncbi:MAG: hypothetical protein HKN82_18545 [Akkermansiaceae bacterium]|nr:hypothetical protein [Akkermansiaceae bacterium]NNM30550.1 hypothetical protein [Akkermansiaceae bacterium]
MKILILLLVFTVAGLPARGAAVFPGAIPDPATFDPSEAVTPNVSQIFTDFPGFSSMSIDDLAVAATQRRIVNVTTLLRAQGGFPSFQEVTGYQVSVFSDPAAAGAGLEGDIASVLLAPGAGVSVIPFAPAISDEYGLVSLNLDILLPTAGTYWLGVAPVAASTVAGQFFTHNSPSGIPASPGNARFANPGGGFAVGPLTLIGAELAQEVVLIPEPAAGLLLIVAALAGFHRRRPVLPH